MLPGEGGKGVGEEPTYEGKKVWASVNHSLLSDLQVLVFKSAKTRYVNKKLWN